MAESMTSLQESAAQHSAHIMTLQQSIVAKQTHMQVLEDDVTRQLASTNMLQKERKSLIQSIKVLVGLHN